MKPFLHLNGLGYRSKNRFDLYMFFFCLFIYLFVEPTDKEKYDRLKFVNEILQQLKLCYKLYHHYVAIHIKILTIAYSFRDTYQDI